MPPSLKNPPGLRLTMWSLFKTDFIGIMRLLTDKTNLYANRDKNKHDF